MPAELLPDTPEAKNWVYEAILKNGIPFYFVEGYSVKSNNVTALFERRKSTIEVGGWTEPQICEWLEKKEENDPWLARIALARSLNIPLYLVLWSDSRENFRVLSVDLKDEGQIVVVDRNLFNSCGDLAQWMSHLKGITVTKSFIEPGRLSYIDRCLRKHGVPWPGNLDGFLFNKTSKAVKAIFEFSRTRKFPVKSHDLNLYFSKDINRWKPLDILRLSLNAPLYIIIWSSDEEIVKLHEVQNVTDNALIFRSSELLTIEQLVSKLFIANKNGNEKV